jgi:hypothetical protein
VTLQIPLPPAYPWEPAKALLTGPHNKQLQGQMPRYAVRVQIGNNVCQSCGCCSTRPLPPVSKYVVVQCKPHCLPPTPVLDLVHSHQLLELPQLFVCPSWAESLSPPTPNHCYVYVTQGARKLPHKGTQLG